MKAGFIGLGNLGKTMARRLLSEGVDLTVWNRTREKALDLGCPVAETPAALAKAADVIFLNLFDSKAVQSVLSGGDGLMAGGLKGKIIVDTTTNHCEWVPHFHRSVSEQGGRYLEAPILGSVVPAAQGTLTFLVSGDEEAFRSVRGLLEKMGKTLFYLETPSRATAMKLVNNLLLGVFMAGIAEAVAFGEAAGVDKEKILDILAAGAGNSVVLSTKRAKILSGDFSAHFSSTLLYKDLHYLQDMARALKRPLFTGSAVKELYALTFVEGKEDLDFSAIYDVLKKR
jgi:3-hydroxyisobutyrate dehydrogenase